MRRCDAFSARFLNLAESKNSWLKKGQLTEEFFGKLKDCLPAKAKIKHFWSYLGDIGYSESNLALMGQI